MIGEGWTEVMRRASSIRRVVWFRGGLRGGLSDRCGGCADSRSGDGWRGEVHEHKAQEYGTGDSSEDGWALLDSCLRRWVALGCV